MFTRPSSRKKPVMERLIVTAHPSKPGRFSAHLESTGAPVVTNSKQPLVDGARELLSRGFNPRTPLTMRHERSTHDSFQPLRSAGGRGGLTRREKERPFGSPVDAVFRREGSPKVDLRTVRCTRSHSRANTTVRSDISDGRLIPSATRPTNFQDQAPHLQSMFDVHPAHSDAKGEAPRPVSRSLERYRVGCDCPTAETRTLNDTGRKFSLQLLLRHYTPPRTKRVSRAVDIGGSPGTGGPFGSWLRRTFPRGGWLIAWRE